VKAGVLTVSDGVSAGEREDRSGAVLEELLSGEGWEVERVTVPDERDAVSAAVRTLAGRCDVVLTTGGTGVAPRDVTPEATRAVLSREAPGFAEAMRWAAVQVTPHGMLSRGISGIAGMSLIVNFPGSPKAVREGFPVIAPTLAHAVRTLRGDSRHGARD
jgi:molybdopterin adenylyltransferase